MSEFRQDKLRNHWVIIAEERAERPQRFETFQSATSNNACPFCRGHEEQTPPALLSLPAPPKPWQVRVCPNKYPAVGAQTESDPATLECDLLTQQPGAGRHEVIIESSDHVTRATELDEIARSYVWRAYAERLRAAGDDAAMQYARIFQNCGPAAGASIEHLHSQLIALPFVPNDSAKELEQSRLWFQKRGCTGLSELIAAERQAESRMIAEENGFAVFCPYASRFPYEVWIAPINSEPRFESSRPESIEAAGRLAQTVLACYDKSLRSPDYNYLIQSAPFDRSAEDHYHWRIELFPRITTAAGFEMSSGCFVNPVRPESAAAEIRDLWNRIASGS